MADAASVLPWIAAGAAVLVSIGTAIGARAAGGTQHRETALPPPPDPRGAHPDQRDVDDLKARMAKVETWQSRHDRKHTRDDLRAALQDERTLSHLEPLLKAKGISTERLRVEPPPNGDRDDERNTGT